MVHHLKFISLIENSNFQNYDCSKLSSNINAIEFLERNPKMIDWFYMSKNENAILTNQNIDKICRSTVCCNKNAIEIIIKIMNEYPNELNFEFLSINTHPDAIQLLEQNLFYKRMPYLSCNTAAVHILKIYPALIDWVMLSSNTHPDAIQLIEQNLDKICWHTLSSNPSAVHILLKYPEKIIWFTFSSNSNPSAVKLLIENLDKINWSTFSSNTHPDAIRILEQNIHKADLQLLAGNVNALHVIINKSKDIEWKNKNWKILWSGLSTNPNIFEYDYKSMKSRCDIFAEELIKNRFHPDIYFKKKLDWGYDEDEDDDNWIML